MRTIHIGAIVVSVIGLLSLLVAPVAAAATTGVTVDTSFARDGGLAGGVTAMVRQPDGKLLVAGDFEAVNGVARNDVARINADGTLDATFNPGTGPELAVDGRLLPGRVDAVALQTDGKVILAGVFDQFNGVARTGMVRLTVNGAVDPTFNVGAGPMLPGFSGTVDSLLILADGSILVGGSFDTFNGASRGGIAKVRPDGTLDPSFGAAGTGGGEVRSLALQPDGKIIVGGSFTTFNGTARASLARVSAAGVLDTSFTPGTGPQLSAGGASMPGVVETVAVRGDGTIIVGGWFDSFNGVARGAIVALTSAGNVNVGFAAGGGFGAEGYVPSVHAMAVQPNGSVVVGGDFESADGASRTGVARLTNSGALDEAFVPSGGGIEGGAVVHRLLLQPDGQVVIGGDFQSVGSSVRFSVARFGATGALDSGFNPVLARGVGFNGLVHALAVQPDGKVVVAGEFTTYNGVPRRGVARLLANGSLDSSFDPGEGANSQFGGLADVQAVAVAPDGKILIGGWFDVVGGEPRQGVARLLPNGALDTDFHTVDGIRGAWGGDGAVSDIVVLPDGKILIGGWFAKVDGANRSGLARLLPDGRVDTSFDTGSGFNGDGVPGAVETLALTSSGGIMAGGTFVTFNGTPRAAIALLTANGSLNSSFNPGSGFTAAFNGDATVKEILLQPDGKLIAVGDFVSYNGVPRGSIARLSPSGVLDAGYAAGAGFSGGGVGGVDALLPLPGGQVLAGGDFGEFDGATRAGLARLTATGGLDTTFAADLNEFDQVYALAAQPDGKIIVGGDFTGIGRGFPTAINIARLSLAQVPAGPPTALTVTPGASAAAVSFTAPADRGSAEITNYQYSINGGSWTNRAPASATPSVVVNGLTPGQTYQIRIRAVSAAGPGAASAPVTAAAAAPPASTFVPIAPTRVLDTRPTSGGAGPLAAGESRLVPVGAVGATAVVPSGAVAIAYNITVPSPTTSGHLRMMPGDAATLTAASAVNFRAGETIANAAVVKVDAARQVKIYAAAPANAILDVVGYFVPTTSAPTAPGKFTAVTPVRVFDSAAFGGDLAPGTSQLVSTATAMDGTTPVVPAGASAVAYNITVVRPTGPGHLRVMPGNVASTPSSAINWAVPGDVIANGSAVQLDGQRQIRVFNGSSVPVRYLVDVVGYYSAGGAQFYPIDPSRVLDTRLSQGGAGPIPPGATAARTASVATTTAVGLPVVPAGASAIANNLTVTGTVDPGHLRAYPAGAALVSASVVNWPGAGFSRANGSVVGISADRSVTIYNGSSATAEAIVDVLGYYR